MFVIVTLDNITCPKVFGPFLTANAALDWADIHFPYGALAKLDEPYIGEPPPEVHDEYL